MVGHSNSNGDSLENIILAVIRRRGGRQLAIGFVSDEVHICQFLFWYCYAEVQEFTKVSKALAFKYLAAVDARVHITNKILEMNPEDEAEEDGANIDLDSERKGKCVVLKTSTRRDEVVELDVDEVGECFEYEMDLAFKYPAAVDAQVCITNKVALGKVLAVVKKKMSTPIEDVNDITPEYLYGQQKKVKESYFGHLFLHFNVKFNAGVVHHLLRRQVHTFDKTIMEFNFGGNTAQIRDDHFSRADVITNAMVKEVSTNMTQWMEDDDMVKLSLLYILECGILGKESHNEIKMDHVSLVWGYEAILKLGRLFAHKSNKYDVVALEVSTGEDDMLTTSELDHNAHHYTRSAADKGEDIPKYIIPPSMKADDVIYEEEVVNKEETEVVNKDESVVVNKEEEAELVNKEDVEEAEVINKEESEAINKEDNEDVNMEEKENKAVNNQDNRDVNKEDKTNEATNEAMNEDEFEIVNKDDNVNNTEDKEAMVDIKDTDQIYIPINFVHEHWMLARVDIIRGCVILYDLYESISNKNMAELESLGAIMPYFLKDSNVYDRRLRCVHGQIRGILEGQSPIDIPPI
ncbi:hypothetical protein FNV43_RR05738 [Rhamnella rubrinervis]|uniref:Ubiquitin-like protease family profile domain-containing protein n=1 Tax=Rhamnella rubrinervis TaxID=2594499 RepID=A0A8K0HMP1_9ROSA|nr:hypothetical protein FNV43_RR05738 [Rhamnella rubrinervis]